MAIDDLPTKMVIFHSDVNELPKGVGCTILEIQLIYQ